MDEILQFMAIITEEYPSSNWSGMWATVIVGVSVVFLILLVLIGFLYLIGYIMHGSGKSKQKKTKPLQSAAADTKKAPAVPAPAPVQSAVEEAADEEYDEDDEEIIAVISAAIAAYSEQDGTVYTIKKIKRSDKQPRSAWGNAGVIGNTRPF